MLLRQRQAEDGLADPAVLAAWLCAAATAANLRSQAAPSGASARVYLAFIAPSAFRARGR